MILQILKLVLDLFEGFELLAIHELRVHYVGVAVVHFKHVVHLDEVLLALDRLLLILYCQR